MKPETHSFDVQSTMSGEKIAMGIRVEDMSHIMGVMTDLYKNRLLAVLREYSTNAWDAHQQAGISLPIEVSLPSAFAPTLKIRDYGCGLDVGDIREVYSQYGRSTKRASNDQVGMLGLGCKSALTYTSQFTVTSVKDGRRVTVLVARDEEGAGSMQILGDVATEDANGTEVTVAVRSEDMHRCVSEAATFFSYWSPGSVLVNGKTPALFSGLKLSNTLYLIPNERPEDSKIVMGNVAYPFSFPQIKAFAKGSLVAFVPIGAVKPTPSRESLMDTAATKKAADEIIEQVRSALSGAIQRDVDRADSPQAALKTIADWSQTVVVSGQSFTYKGRAIPASFELPSRDYEYPMRIALYRDGYWRKSATTGTDTIPSLSWPTTVWVSNYKPEKFTAQHKNKLRAWADAAGLTESTCSRFVLLKSEAPVSFFIDPAMVAPWEVVRKIKLTAATTSSGYGRLTGSFDVFTEKGWESEVPGDDLRQGEPLFWRPGNRWENDRFQDVLRRLYPKFTLVCLPRNRVAKFTRETTTAIRAEDAVQGAFDAWVSKQAEDDLKALAMWDAHIGVNAYRKLDPSRINDPAIKEAIALAKHDVSALSASRDAFKRVVDVARMKVKAVHPLAAYPLFYESHATHDHMYIYLNAAYAARG